MSVWPWAIFMMIWDSSTPNKLYISCISTVVMTILHYPRKASERRYQGLHLRIDAKLALFIFTALCAASSHLWLQSRIRNLCWLYPDLTTFLSWHAHFGQVRGSSDGCSKPAQSVPVQKSSKCKQKEPGPSCVCTDWRGPNQTVGISHGRLTGSTPKFTS